MFEATITSTLHVLASFLSSKRDQFELFGFQLLEISVVGSVLLLLQQYFRVCISKLVSYIGLQNQILAPS